MRVVTGNDVALGVAVFDGVVSGVSVGAGDEEGNGDGAATGVSIWDVEKSKRLVGNAGCTPRETIIAAKATVAATTRIARMRYFTYPPSGAGPQRAPDSLVLVPDLGGGLGVPPNNPRTQAGWRGANAESVP
jgi:hypothetical protein